MQKHNFAILLLKQLLMIAKLSTLLLSLKQGLRIENFHSQHFICVVFNSPKIYLNYLSLSYLTCIVNSLLICTVTYIF